VRLDLPVLLTLTVAALTAQTALPAAGWMAVKPPVLTAVAAYYALSRELPLALTAALWIGALTDACSGLPFPVTAVWLVGVCAALRAARRFVAEGATWRGMAALAVVAPAQTVWYAVVVGGAGMSGEGYLRGLALDAVGGAVTGWAVFNVCGWLEGLAGNVKGAAGGDGVPWHNADI